MRRTEPIQVRFWRFVQKGDGCWIWTGALDKHGYGRFSVKRSTAVLAHRQSYELNVGSVGDGQCVLHRCDNPQCVNPSHLFLGTKLDNTRDMVNKGRARNQNTERTHCHRGHPLSGENLYMHHGVRYCRECRRMDLRTKRARLNSTAA